MPLAHPPSSLTAVHLLLRERGWAPTGNGRDYYAWANTDLPRLSVLTFPPARRALWLIEYEARDKSAPDLTLRSGADVRALRAALDRAPALLAAADERPRL